VREENRVLYQKLYDFVREAVGVLSKTLNVDEIQILSRHNVERKDNMIFLYGEDDWRKIEGLRVLASLRTLKEITDVCKRHEQIKSLNGKWSYAFDFGSSFTAENVPVSFLLELLSRQTDCRLNKNLFDKIFNLFLGYISGKDEWYTRVVVPLDNIQITGKVIDLGRDSRIRRLSAREYEELRSYCPVLNVFYGTFFSPWFQCSLEFDIPFQWVWIVRDENDTRPFMQVTSSRARYQAIKRRINEEIVILRAFMNRVVSAPTYFIDYRGWRHLDFAGGFINQLPWVRPSVPASEEIKVKEITKYRRYRERFLQMKGREAQHVFVAMRKLAFGMDKPYSGDQIMDMVSGLEGLLVGEDTEVRHKFAERVALLLGKTVKQRLILQKDMKDAYDFRSKVAHGLVMTDEIDSLVSQAPIGHKLTQKQIGELKKVLKLRLLTRALLHQAILVCIDRQTTNFDWDLALLSSRLTHP
jgi:hypothetical protein